MNLSPNVVRDMLDIQILGMIKDGKVHLEFLISEILIILSEIICILSWNLH